MTFEELNLSKPLLKALTDLEYINPTPIQAQAFPVIMAGRNVVGIAQTGTGKTFAYLLPILRQLTFSDQKDPRVLIMAPTRELAIQILNEIEKLTRYTQIRSAAIYGGANINSQKIVINNGLDIIVATPGRLIDLTFTGVLRLKFIQKLVIDEVDEMLGLGFQAQINSLLDLLPARRQNLLFSATLTAEVDALITNSIAFPHKIEIVPHGTPIDKIIQKAYHVPNFNTKFNLLGILLSDENELNKALVFAGTKRMADIVFEKMNAIFPDQVSVIHSNKSDKQRLNALRQFQEGPHRILIATDIVARGMDIVDVSHVINFDIPKESTDYIHRIGRTGRADKDGVAISLVHPTELNNQEEIEKLMRKLIPVEPLPENLVISTVLTEDEKPSKLFDKNYFIESTFKGSKGAFHPKSEKNRNARESASKKKKDKSGKTIMTRKSNKTRF